jgi:hypothetical protein
MIHLEEALNYNYKYFNSLLVKVKPGEYIMICSCGL